MLGLAVTPRPDDGFGAVGEVAARKVGRRIYLEPRDIIENFKVQRLHRKADAIDDVVGAADPDRAVGFEQALAGGEPAKVEFVVGLNALRAVPSAFIDRDHPPRFTGLAAVG